MFRTKPRANQIAYTIKVTYGGIMEINHGAAGPKVTIKATRACYQSSDKETWTLVAVGEPITERYIRNKLPS